MKNLVTWLPGVYETQGRSTCQGITPWQVMADFFYWLARVWLPGELYAIRLLIRSIKRKSFRFQSFINSSVIQLIPRESKFIRVQISVGFIYWVTKLLGESISLIALLIEPPNNVHCTTQTTHLLNWLHLLSRSSQSHLFLGSYANMHVYEKNMYWSKRI